MPFIKGHSRSQNEDIARNARPYFSRTPVNDLNLRVYAENVYLRSVGNVRQVIAGLLCAHNFSPKSWIYFALDELPERRAEYDSAGNFVFGWLEIDGSRQWGRK